MWPLIVLGIVLIIATGVLRDFQFNSGTTTETNNKNEVTRVSKTKAPPSDALLLGLLGVAAAFVLCGAFYSRISKVSFPGGAIELAEAQKEAAAAVERAVERRGGGKTLEPPAQVAATILTAARAIEIGRVASVEPSAVASLASAAKLPFDVEGLTRTGQLTREMWDSLAEAALAEVTAAKHEGEDKPSDS
jgi:hypothetical protein